jgi:hypothetical protein
MADTTARGPIGDAEAIVTEERSQLRIIASRFVRHRLAMASLVLLVSSRCSRSSGRCCGSGTTR